MPAPKLTDGLLAWWGLGDFAGEGSTMADHTDNHYDGTWHETNPWVGGGSVSGDLFLRTTFEFASPTRPEPIIPYTFDATTGVPPPLPPDGHIDFAHGRLSFYGPQDNPGFIQASYWGSDGRQYGWNLGENHVLGEMFAIVTVYKESDPSAFITWKIPVRGIATGNFPADGYYLIGGATGLYHGEVIARSSPTPFADGDALIMRGWGKTTAEDCLADHNYYQQVVELGPPGPPGGEWEYPGGFPPYSADSMSFVIDIASLSILMCGYKDDVFAYPAYGVGHYSVGDRIIEPHNHSSGLFYEAFIDFVSDGSQPPGTFVPGSGGTIPYWVEVFPSDPCAYDTYAGHERMGVCGDRSGFPFDQGWAIITKDARHLRLVSGTPDGVGNYPFELDMGEYAWRHWQRIGFTCDGTTVKTYSDGLLVASAPMGTHFGLSNGSLRFGAVDENRALSGGYNVWNGWLDEARIWNRPLSGAEMFRLAADPEWCHFLETHSLSAAFRAEPGSAAPVTDTSMSQHLSGVRFRAEPGSAPAGPSTPGTELAHLSGTRFRAERE
jgi:hypothetical protein